MTNRGRTGLQFYAKPISLGGTESRETAVAVKGRRATQADVARLAGVSQTTVSMVLNGTGVAQRRVSAQVRERVLEAIAVTGYAANPSAQLLAGGRSSIIGVYTYEPVFPHAGANFYYPFLEGIEDEAERSGVDLLMFTSMSGRSGKSLVSTGRVARLRVADGCVLLGRRSYHEDLAELLRQDFPFAFVGRREAPGGQVPYAAAAYGDATRAVVERLVELGHERIALVNEFTGHESIEDRSRGYHEAMVAAGLQPVVYNGPDPESAAFLDSLLGAGVTAALVTSDLAAPLRRVALARGLDVPRDLSIARLGDPERPNGEDVDWSGFLIPRWQMGAHALRLVLRQLTADPAEAGDLQVSLPCTLVPGATVAPRP